MASLALAFDVIARDKGASRTLNDIGDAAQQAGKRSEGFGKSIKSAMGVAAGAIAAAGIGSALKDMVTGASDLAETINKSNVIFGKNADKVRAWSRDAARSFGLSSEAALGAATNFGNMLQQLGYTGDAALEASTGTVQLAADLGSFNNLDTEDVLDRIGAAMRGEYDSLQLLIPNINAARVEQEALAMTGKDAAKELTAQEKAAATLSIVQRDGAAAAGDFAETQDGLANKSKIVRAQFEDLKDRIGTALLPAFEGLMGFVSDTVLPGFGTLADHVRDHVVPRLADLRNFIRDEVVPRLGEFRDFIVDEVVPRVQDFAAVFSDKVKPAIEDVKRYIDETFRPALDELQKQITNNIVPAFEEMQQSVKENEGSFDLLKWAMERGKEEVSGFLTQVTKLGGYLSATGMRIVTEWNRSMEALRDLWADLTDKGDAFMDAMKNFRVPRWVETVADALGRVANSLGISAGGLGGLAGRMGDGPGRYGGGNTLARVKGLLPSGAVITSTYRTAAQNAAVGGVPGSYHTDRANPAVDVAGTRAAMDAFYAKAAAVGGWRELLYKTAGHWDHVHVAHNGGTVSANWPKMPGWAANERPVRAQVGEQIVPVGARPLPQTVNWTVNNYGPHLTQAQLRYAQRTQEVLDPSWS